MAVAKKPGKPHAKSASAAKTAAPKKTASKSKANAPAPAPTAPSASKYAVGDQVSHPMFGEGVVTAIEADKLSIEFVDGVTKQIVDYYVKPRKT